MCIKKVMFSKTFKLIFTTCCRGNALGDYVIYAMLFVPIAEIEKKEKDFEDYAHYLDDTDDDHDDDASDEDAEGELETLLLSCKTFILFLRMINKNASKRIMSNELSRKTI